MTLDDLVGHPPAVELLGCLEDALAGHPDKPAIISLRTGDQVELLAGATEDECCAGLAWVRIVTWYPSREFPEQDTTYQRCNIIQWAVVLELGVARCAPMADTSLPDAATWNAAVLAVNLDSAAMQKAVCCFAELDPDRMYLVGPWAPLRTEGGCMGGTVQVTVAMPPCNCQEE